MKTIFDKLDTLKKEKSPTPKSKKNYIGVELEFFCTKQQRWIGVALADLNLEKYCNLGTDGSIEPEFGHPYELRILAPENEIYQVIEKVTTLLTILEAGVNHTCGLHVHLDMRNRNKNKTFKNLFHSQPILYSMVSETRRRNRHCEPITSTDFIDTGRPGINAGAYSVHKTIEIRIHSGTLDAEKINNWIKLLLTISKARRELTTTFTTIDQLNHVIKFDPELVTYVQKRVKYFKKFRQPEPKRSLWKRFEMWFFK